MSHILITGASSGIGAACGQLLAAQGHEVWMVARREDRLNALTQSLKKQGFKAEHSVLDLTDDQATARFAEEHQTRLETVDVLLNNAGLARGAEPLQHGQWENWRAMFETNVMAVLRFTQLVLPHMVRKRRGHIVNLGSVAGRWGYPGGNVYCASKSAVHMLSECLRLDLSGLGIRVTEILPGMVETEFSQVRFQDSTKAKAVYAGMTPLTSEDIAETVAWCLSRPAHVNIQEVVVYPTDQAAPSVVARKP